MRFETTNRLLGPQASRLHLAQSAQWHRAGETPAVPGRCLIVNLHHYLKMQRVERALNRRRRDSTRSGAR